MSTRAVRLISLLFFFFFTGLTNLSAQSLTVEPSAEQLSTGEPFIYRIAPDARGGEAYKLVYLVPVPIEVFWKFKTDFYGDFVETNKYVINQRVISEEQRMVIIENRLSNKPDSTFRWRNVLYPSKYRLDFFLENPEQCGQRFHYGHFQLEPLGSYTKVSHAAYFDFFGASLWSHYPWEGGMYAFLDYIARWEQETILKVRDDYE